MPSDLMTRGRETLIVAGVLGLMVLAGCSAPPGSRGALSAGGVAGPVTSSPAATPPGFVGAEAANASTADKDQAAEAGEADDWEAEIQADLAAADSDENAGTRDSGTSGAGASSASGASGASGDRAVAGRGRGCPAGGTAVPPDAGRARAGDLDGDGAADTVWLAIKDGHRVLGVRTAGGATFSVRYSTEYDTAARRPRAMGDRLGDGTAVILLDVGSQARLFAVRGCRIVVTRNVQGQQYTFDQGVTGFGSGAGCPGLGSSGRALAGYLAWSQGAGYAVTRTVVDLSDGGRLATNGTATTVGSGLGKDSSTVRNATTVSCGTSRAAQEPLS